MSLADDPFLRKLHALKDCVTQQTVALVPPVVAVPPVETQASTMSLLADLSSLSMLVQELQAEKALWVR
jgi:hypothetical protein